MSKDVHADLIKNRRRNVYTNHEKAIQNLRKSIPNWPRIYQTTIKLDSWILLERFRRHFGTRSAPGRPGQFDGVTCGRAFGWKRRSKGPFWDPPWILNGSKILLSSADRRLDPPKIASGKVIGKTMNKYEKSMRKSIFFDGSKPRLALYSLFFSHFGKFSKESKSRWKKGCHEWRFFYKNWRFWAPLFA